MIEILGLNQGQEYDAALHLKRRMLDVWPNLSRSIEDHIKIFVGLKLYGHQTEDLDLLVIGQFKEDRDFDVEFKFYQKEGEPYIPKRASIKNFALLIEAKSHDAAGVKFHDKIAMVKYPSGWESATEKNRKQVFELKKYLRRHGLHTIYIQDLIFFSGLREKDLPKRPHNCFGVDASFERVLNIIGQVSLPRQSRRYVTISHGPEKVFDSIISGETELLKTIEPTPLDRRRMDRIIKSAISNEWLSDLGKKQVRIRGRGGVGKTVILLQMSYKAYDSLQYRSLLLTYNKALVADMRRTMALLGVPRHIEKGGISIETVHSFVGKIMRELGVIQEDDNFIENYEHHKQTLIEFINTGAITENDIDRVREDNSEAFQWDLIFIDEGQDWPTDEISIMRYFYPSENIVVADGVDQYVRASVADWDHGMDKSTRRTRRLRRCLRMKANLAKFVSNCAEELGLDDWDLEPNPDANGGRVIIVEGDMANDVEIYKRICSEALSMGNYPVDLLACVPPNLVKHSESETYSVPGQNIIAGGGNVWDATSVDVREYYPTERDALRIVQYDSCRGLEGWAVINYAFDEFYEHKRSQWLESPEEIGGLFDSKEDLAKSYSAQWSMIPLTRAMDTLVINITDRSSEMGKVIARVAESCADFVEWV